MTQETSQIEVPKTEAKSKYRNSDSRDSDISALYLRLKKSHSDEKKIERGTLQSCSVLYVTFKKLKNALQ